MKRVVVQYKVKFEQAELNTELNHAVYEELEQRKPDGLRHATLRLADGVTGIHIADERGEGPSPLAALDSFQRCEAGIAERCKQPAPATETDEVGSFRMFTSRKTNQ